MLGHNKLEKKPVILQQEGIQRKFVLSWNLSIKNRNGVGKII